MEIKFLRDTGLTMVNVVNSHVYNQSDLSRVCSICDAILSLRSENVGVRLLRALDVTNILVAWLGTGSVFIFDAKPTPGMKKLPVSKARV